MFIDQTPGSPPAIDALERKSWPVGHAFSHGAKTFAIPLLLLGVIIVLPVSFLCPVTFAWVYILWAVAGICSVAIVVLSILPQPGNISKIGSTNANNKSTAEHLPQTSATVKKNFSTQTDTQVPTADKDHAWDIDAEFERARVTGELLPLSSEMDEKIRNLHLPPEDKIPSNIRRILNYCEIHNDESLRKYMRFALQIPIYQRETESCFAVSHLIRWQRDDPEIIFKMLSKILLKGRCKIYGMRDIIFIYPNFNTIDSSPSQLLIASFADSYERRLNAASGSTGIGGVLGELFKELLKIDDYMRHNKDQKIRTDYMEFFAKHSSYLVAGKFPPFESEKVRITLNGETGIRYRFGKSLYQWVQVNVDPNRMNDLDLWEKIGSAYGLVDFVMYRFLAGRHCWHWDSVRDGFCLDVPFEDLLKECKFPKSLRKIIMTYLQCNLGSSNGDENDLVVRGNMPISCVTFPAMIGAKNLEIHTSDIAGALATLLKAKIEWNLRPNKLVPVDTGNHVANLIVPEINSLDEFQDGQHISFMLTNWDGYPIIYVLKQGDSYFYADRQMQPGEIPNHNDDPMKRYEFTKLILSNPIHMKPCFKECFPPVGLANNDIT